MKIPNIKKIIWKVWIQKIKILKLANPINAKRSVFENIFFKIVKYPFLADLESVKVICSIL